MTMDGIIVFGICSALFMVPLTAPLWENYVGKCVLYQYINNDKKNKSIYKRKIFRY